MAVWTALPEGSVIDGAWRVDEALGGGGMGTVYACTHLRNGLRVALKILHAHGAKDPSTKQRFLSEGLALNRVQHPGVVRALGDGVVDGAPYLVMELAVGRSLRAVAASLGGRMTIDALRSVIDGVLDALGAVHAAGVVHRDVKPDNVIVTNDGRIKLVDFGIARLDTVGGETSTGTVLGTVAYMAPEQVMGKLGMVDARADLFSVGAVLFKLLTGRNVHEGVTGVELLLAMGTQQAPSVRTALPTLPRPVVAFVDRALAFDRDRRFQTAAEMRAAWARVFDGSAVEPPRVGAGKRWPMWTFPMLAVAIAGLAIGAALLWASLGDAPKRGTRADETDEERQERRAKKKAKASANASASARDVTPVPALPQPQKGSSDLCRWDLSALRDALNEHPGDRFYGVFVNEEFAGAVAYDAADQHVAISCFVGSGCLRSTGTNRLRGQPFTASQIPLARFRTDCDAAVKAYRADHKVPGVFDDAYFDLSTVTQSWMIRIDGAEGSELYCFFPDGSPTACRAR